MNISQLVGSNSTAWAYPASAHPASAATQYSYNSPSGSFQSSTDHLQGEIQSPYGHNSGQHFNNNEDDFENMHSRPGKRRRPYDISTPSPLQETNVPLYAMPSFPDGVPVEVAKAIATQANLSEDRRQLFFSFHKACSKLEKADAFARLLAHAATLENAEKLDSIASALNVVQQQVAIVHGNANRDYKVTKDMHLHFRMLSRRVLLDSGRTTFINMYIDVMKTVEETADDLGLGNALKVGGSKKKILTTIKTTCNETRESLRRLICHSIIEAGPTRSTLDEFCVLVVEKMGQDTAVNVTRELTAQLALMRAHALEARAQNLLAPVEAPTAPSPATVATESADAADTSDSTTNNGKCDGSFWKGFEKYLKSKFPRNVSKVAHAEIIRQVITADNQRFGGSAATSGSSSSLPAPLSQSAQAAVAASQLINNFLG